MAQQPAWDDIKLPILLQAEKRTGDEYLRCRMVSWPPRTWPSHVVSSPLGSTRKMSQYSEASCSLHNTFCYRTGRPYPEGTHIQRNVLQPFWYIKITSSHSRNAPMASAPLHLFSLHMTSLTVSQEAVLGTYLSTSCFLMQNIDVNLHKI